jgi:hypothetical protein
MLLDRCLRQQEAVVMTTATRPPIVTRYSAAAMHSRRDQAFKTIY